MIIYLAAATRDQGLNKKTCRYGQHLTAVHYVVSDVDLLIDLKITNRDECGPNAQLFLFNLVLVLVVVVVMV